MRKDKNQLVQEALLRRATGYEATETVEEFSESNGELKLVKRRVSTKNVPADVAAAKLVMEGCKEELGALTNEQLKKEKRRLLQLLKEVEKNAE